ncbi:hypothetical protein [Enterococcus sp.]|uniref:hypothetical protein n=1 Tax=Enterococcus sp. TaxID=35783 RepID=UPI0028989AA8|nr:hypothetical protein [Enterococcus sp.]
MKSKEQWFHLIFLVCSMLFFSLKGYQLMTTGISPLIMIAYFAFTGIVMIGIYGGLRILEGLCKKVCV